MLRLKTSVLGLIAAVLPGGKRTAVTLAGLIALALGAALVLFGTGRGSDQLARRDGDSSFYLEGSIVVLGVAPPNEARPEESNSTLQWWFQRPGVWRWQLDVEPAEDDPLTMLGVADGKYAYVYKSDSNTYTRVALKDYSFSGLPVSVLLGPIDVVGLVEGWSSRGIEVRGGGSSSFMGRDAQVLEYSPAWRSNDSEGERSGGIGRIWIDSDTGLVVRNLLDGGPANQYVDARVTLLELDPKFHASTFRFEAPNGAQRVEEN